MRYFPLQLHISAEEVNFVNGKCVQPHLWLINTKLSVPLPFGEYRVVLVPKGRKSYPETEVIFADITAQTAYLRNDYR